MSTTTENITETARAFFEACETGKGGSTRAFRSATSRATDDSEFAQTRSATLVRLTACCASTSSRPLPAMG